MIKNSNLHTNYIRKPHRKRKIRITNKKRFTFFMILIFTIIISLGYTLNIAEGASKTEYTAVTVSYGDTLWSIAKEYNEEHLDSKEDVRTIVYVILNENNIDANKIYPGQIIYIPLTFK